MTDFSVVVPTVSSTASPAADSAERLTEHWQRLRADVDAVLTGGWSGAAAAAFDRSWAQWDEGARAVVAALGELAERLAVTARAYAASDVAGAEQFGRLAG